MSTERTKPYLPEEERVVTEISKRRDEGVGVFRGIMLTALLYVGIGLLAWFFWFASRHWLLHR